MSEYKTVTISGLCPYLEKRHRITATYQKIQFLGQSQIQAKCVKTECDIGHECDVPDCPLFKQADDRNHW